MNHALTRPGAQPIRVGYVLKMFPRLSETFILNEVLELEEQGLALHLFSLKLPADAVVHGQTKAVRSPITYLPQTLFQSPSHIARAQIHVLRKHPKAWRRAFRHALRRARADGDGDALLVFSQACCLVREMGVIRHLHAHYANIPARLALIAHRMTGVSYSITTHAKDIFLGNPLLSPKLHERLCRAQFVIANSRFSANHLRAHIRGQTEIHTIYNGLCLEDFPPRTAAPAHPIILSVGRLVEKKGFSDLIRACERLRKRGVKFTCELVGTGRLSSVLKEQIHNSALGGCVRMIGPLPQQILREHYERATVFALPCIEAPDGDRDILPNVVKEAMAIGVPVVTTRLDGIEELIEDGVSGLLVPPGDVAALAVKLELLLGDGGLAQRLADQGRRVIEERFDRRRNFRLLASLLAGTGQASAAETTERTEPVVA
jgi:glycosyltransferase involved in cell wall biosynthesis